MSWLSLFHKEFKALCSHPAIALTVFVGVIFYSFLYPQPYAHQAPRELSLIVVNQDQSPLSLKLERMVDASPLVQIVERVGTIETAQKSFEENRYNGILVIPENFYRDIRLGQRPQLAFAGDATYFLVYGTVIEGLSYASGQFGAELRVMEEISTGNTKEGAIQALSPVHLGIKQVFNSTGAYLSYVLPAIFLLILHHTLIIGTGLLTASQRGGTGYWTAVSTTRLFITRSIVFLSIYTLLSWYYFGVCFELYEIPQQASASDIFSILLPLFLACIFFGIILGRILPKQEYVTVVILLSSLYLVFCTGFIWPLENVPTILVYLVQIFPFGPAVQAFIKLNQMGSGFEGYKDHLFILWGLCLVYGTLAYILLKTFTKKTDKVCK